MNRDDEQYWVGRSAVEELAVAFDAFDSRYSWSLAQCVDVLIFLAGSHAMPDKCPTCEDQFNYDRVSSACGMNTVHWFLAEQVERHGKH